MRKLFLLLFVLVLASLWGCAAFKTARSVNKNVFTSNYNPQVYVQVNPEIPYLGTITKQKSEETTIAETIAYMKKTSWFFCTADEYNKVQKAVIISINEIPESNNAYWLPDLFAWIKHPVDSGIEKIHGKNFQYVINWRKSLPGRSYEDFFEDKGLIVPNCLLMKGLARRTGPEQNIKTYIYYFEKTKCKSIMNRAEKPLSEAQEVYLKNFLEQFNNDVTLLKKPPVMVVDSGENGKK